MLVPGIKYVGNKEKASIVVRTLSPTHPDRKQVFEKGQIKLIGKEITEEIAKYLASEYGSNIVQFLDVEIEGKLAFEEDLKVLHKKFAPHVEKKDLYDVFCEMFKIKFFDELEKENEGLKERVVDLEKSLQELTRLKSKKKPAKKKWAPVKRTTKSPKEN